MATLKIQHQDRDQQQDAARKRVEEEFDRGIQAIRSSPDSDQEIHRDQHRFPKHVEQHEIERCEHADHGTFHDEQYGHETPEPGFNSIP